VSRFLGSDHKVNSLECQQSFGEHSVTVWLHRQAHIVRYASKAKESAYGTRNVHRSDAIGFLHHDKNRASDFLRRYEFELAGGGWEVASVSNRRMLHGGIPEKVSPPDEEPAVNADTHRFFERHLNPTSEALNASSA
jgi:hypothetical protein